MCKVLQYSRPVARAPVLLALIVVTGLSAIEDTRADPDYRIGTGRGEPRVETGLEDRNADGRDDLVVECNGILPVNTTPGSEDDDSISDEADMSTIDGVWSGFKAALESKDLQRIGDFFTEDSKDRYVTLYSYVGNDIANLPATWSNFTPIEISELFALYAFHQNDPSGAHLYRILFVCVPGHGWRIQEM